MNSHLDLPSLSLWRGWVLGVPQDFHCFLLLHSWVHDCPCCISHSTAFLASSTYLWQGVSGIPLHRGDGTARGAQTCTLLCTSRHKLKKKGFWPKELPLDLQFCKQEHKQQLNSKENTTLLLFSQLLVWMLLSGLLLQYHDCVCLTCSCVSWCINTVISPAAWRTTGILNVAQETSKIKQILKFKTG